MAPRIRITETKH